MNGAIKILLHVPSWLSRYVIHETKRLSPPLPTSGCLIQQKLIPHSKYFSYNITLQYQTFVSRCSVSRLKHIPYFILLYFLWRCSQTRSTPSFLRFLEHSQRCTTVGRTPLDKWSGRGRYLCLTTQHSKQTNIHAPGGILTQNFSSRQAVDLSLRRRGNWDWP
jgi:hypothetical protein